MGTDLWNRFIPYSLTDVHDFAVNLAELIVQRVRLERDRSAVYTADVFLYNRVQRRRMVVQFVTITQRNAKWDVDLPPVFQALEHPVKAAVTQALREVERRSDLRSSHIVTINFPVFQDVPDLPGPGQNRVAPGFAWNELYVHSAKRYLWAAEQVASMRVLDLGCGTGYGSKFLARRAQQVVAVDTDPHPLEYGQDTYPDPRVTRLLINPIEANQKLPFSTGEFDVVVCFEVIEHIPIEDMEVFFAEIGRVLKPDGLLLMSTPNKAIYINYPDPYHVSLMTLEDFRRLLDSRFSSVSILGQLRARQLPHTSMEFDIVPDASPDDEIFIAACKGFCGHERRIVLPPRTIWKSTTSAGDSVDSASPNANVKLPPPWWAALWRRLRKNPTGRVMCLHSADWPRWSEVARDGWQICCPSQSLGQGMPSEGSYLLTSSSQGVGNVPANPISLEILPPGSLPSRSVDSLVAFDDNWSSAVPCLKPGGFFLIGTSVFPRDTEQWRASIEQAFDATVHLVDPEADCPWLLAFGWKGARLPAVRRTVLMVAHQRAFRMFGGGETQLFETLVHLRDEGVRADVSASLRLPAGRYDVVHVFSLFHGEKTEALAELRKPTVVSPIFWDYSELRYVSAVIRAIFSLGDATSVSRALAAWKAGTLEVNGLTPEVSKEPPELRVIQGAVVRCAQIALPNGRREAELLTRIFGYPASRITVVPNAVRPELYLKATPDVFVKQFGIKDFVLCAGRIEPVKNQLMLTWALRDSGLPLVLAGREYDPEYAALCRRWAGNNVYWVGELSPELLASAYAAARVHALPSWAETPGLVNLEAGLAGCALVVSNRGAETEYLGDYAFVCDPGDPESIRNAVLQAWNNWDQERQNKCRNHILTHFTWDRTAKVTAAAYEQAVERHSTLIAKDRSSTQDSPGRLAVAWEGSQFVHHSLALVNRELCLALMDAGHEISIIPYEAHEFGPEEDERFYRLAERFLAPLSRSPDVYVRHQWPPKFIAPTEGHWVMIQPWEFGSLPVSWVDAMRRHVDEIWVPSSYVRECYIRSGVPADRVFVVPNGVNPDQFHVNVPPIDLTRFGDIDKHFKFLFVGGTIWRKGIDILLRAYQEAFNSDDDVCLVIKDMGGRSFYRGQTLGEYIHQWQQNPKAPSILYVDRDLSPHEIPQLYRACDCLVHPYRGEGFGLPIAEAMACGIPVIVTGYGAALDFCSEDTAYLVPAYEKRLPQRRIGEWETVDYPWVAEPDLDELMRVMRYVYEHQNEARAKGLLASKHIRTNFTWEKACNKVVERITALREQPIRRFQRETSNVTWKSTNDGNSNDALRHKSVPINFLLMPDWNDPRDQWASALEEFVKEFRPTEQVAVLLRVDPDQVGDVDAITKRLQDWERARGFGRDDGHLFLLLSDRLPIEEKHRMYEVADVFVSTAPDGAASHLVEEARSHGVLICEPNAASMRAAWKAARDKRVLHG